VHLARSFADRIIALREGALLEDAAMASFDNRSLEQLYERPSDRRRIAV
jgi:ABC-type phosphate/phosphonate transport system ATPase subunit